MFDKKDSTFEIERCMEKVLIANAVDKQTEDLSTITSAIEHLNAAAEIFDVVGLYKHAEITTSLLESLAKKKTKSSKPKKKKCDDTKDLTSEKMLDNLAHKGWVFNADDAHDDDCECSSCKKPVNHGHDCVCHKCNDVNDSKDSQFWNDMTARYSKENELKKAEEAKMKELFEDDNDVRHEILPPAMEEDVELPDLKPYYPTTDNWHDIEETDRDTIPAMPAAKKFHQELEELMREIEPHRRKYR